MNRPPLDDTIVFGSYQSRPNLTRVIRRVSSAMTGRISSKRARYLNRTSLTRPRYSKSATFIHINHIAHFFDYL